jgi:plasmid maintenance system antidote protein VapI
MSAEFWLGLQQDWDIWHALRSKGADEIANLEPLAEAKNSTR